MDGCNTSFYLSYFYRHHGVSPYYGSLLAGGNDAEVDRGAQRNGTAANPIADLGLVESFQQ